MFALDYFALLFLIVYVGAIVVLFLFIVMMLELKMVNLTERFSDLFNYRNLVLPALFIEILLLEQSDIFTGISNVFSNENPLLAESNLYVDYSKVLVQTDLIAALGVSMFLYEKTGILLSSLLLFVSMVGSIVLTMDSKALHSLKGQDANLQAMRSPFVALKSIRKWNIENSNK